LLPDRLSHSVQEAPDILNAPSLLGIQTVRATMIARCSRARDSNPFLEESSHTLQAEAASLQEVNLTPLELEILIDILRLNKA
jgi:hypothetical protein